MGYPERLLSSDERIERQFRPHWSRLIREGLLVLAGVVLAILAAVAGAPEWVSVAIVAVIMVLIARGVITYLTTLHVITNERLIYRAGFIAKRGKEIPLEVINDVAFNQTIFERVFRTGDLLIESAGTHGQTRYSDIPDPEEVQSLIYQVREVRKLQLEGNAGGAEPAGETVAAQLDTLSRLHDQGKLSDAEFEAEKNKLLGGM
jgi:uncharacterized membrane protein YdbT with pleckstrin-like domain